MEMNREEFIEEFIEEVIKKVRELPISSVLETRIDVVRRGYSFQAKCPFHNDNKLGSFHISDKKGIFKCFSCNEGGDAISFITKYDKIKFGESAIKIALEFGLITKEECNEVLGEDVSAEMIGNVEKVYFDYKEKINYEEERADIEVLHNVFSVFSRGLSICEGHEKLTVEHKEYLKGRGLSDKDIESDGYFSFPGRHSLYFGNFYKSLYEEFGYTPEILKDVPGFYCTENYKMPFQTEDGEIMVPFYLFKTQEGICIPIKNAKGQIAGIQIRLDETHDDSRRYIWFSSTFAEEGDGRTMYMNGTGAGAPLDVVYPERIKHTTLFITEGRFKARKIASTYGCVAISVQGISSWRNIENEIKNIEEKTGLEIKHICVAYDADMSYNINVYNQFKKMTDKLKTEFDKNIYICMWATELGKGIDDIIENNKSDMIDKMEKSQFDSYYAQYVKMVTEKEGKKAFKEKPKPLLKAYFDREVLPKFDKYKDII
ncbi:CHC2 zinc finger domain-containing protein [Bacillus sp. NPDC094106]|uniref:CHC2 zinc finger domain-containing protein n=1 Tax=Bacillus sp. NPDC094106 TaxID=3363949 RepID=UPI0037FE9877